MFELLTTFQPTDRCVTPQYRLETVGTLPDDTIAVRSGFLAIQNEYLRSDTESGCLAVAATQFGLKDRSTSTSRAKNNNTDPVATLRRSSPPMSDCLQIDLNPIDCERNRLIVCRSAGVAQSTSSLVGLLRRKDYLKL